MVSFLALLLDLMLPWCFHSGALFGPSLFLSLDSVLLLFFLLCLFFSSSSTSSCPLDSSIQTRYLSSIVSLDTFAHAHRRALPAESSKKLKKKTRAREKERERARAREKVWSDLSPTITDPVRGREQQDPTRVRCWEISETETEPCATSRLHA